MLNIIFNIMLHFLLMLYQKDVIQNDRFVVYCVVAVEFGILSPPRRKTLKQGFLTFM